MEKELKDRRIILKSYKENEKFGIIITDPILLCPDIENIKLKEKEVYELYNNSSNDYNGTHKGQYVLGLIFESLGEMFDAYIELKRLGYNKSKVYKEDDRQLDRVFYNLETIENWTYTNHTNIITVQINKKELDKFKIDLLVIGKKISSKFVWGSEDLFEGDYINNNKRLIIK